jgi:hypothetical protein
MSSPGADIFVLNDTRGDRHHGCTIVMENLMSGLELRGRHVTATLPCGAFLESRWQWQRAFERSPVIVLNGEGTLHHERPYARYLLERVRDAVQAGKAVHVINATWEANSADMAACLRDVRSVWTRDPGSAEELATQGITAQVAADLTFYSRYPEPARRSTDRIVVTDSVIAERAHLLAALATDHDCLRMPLLRPPVLRGAGAAPTKWLKYQAYRRLQAAGIKAFLPRQHYLDLCFALESTDEWRARLASAAAMLSGRYHGTCLALQHRVPVISIASNTAKITRLLQAAGLDTQRRLISPEHLAVQARTPGFTEWLLTQSAWTEDERLTLLAYLEDSRRQLDLMLDGIAADG